jgi:hypothetical protein
MVHRQYVCGGTSGGLLSPNLKHGIVDFSPGDASESERLPLRVTSKAVAALALRIAKSRVGHHQPLLASTVPAIRHTISWFNLGL